MTPGLNLYMWCHELYNGVVCVCVCVWGGGGGGVEDGEAGGG